MNEATERALEHLRIARYHTGAVAYSIKAAITELHRTGPHAEKAAHLLRPLNQLIKGLHHLIRTMEAQPAPPPATSDSSTPGGA